MYYGLLPLLTKGPFALFYGGESIIGDLSEEAPGRGTPILLLGSAIFQISLFCMKQAKSRKLKYTHSLIKTLVENVLNIYGIIVIIAISLVSVAYIILHHWRIQKNNDEKIDKKLLPKEIYILYSVVLFITVVPYGIIGGGSTLAAVGVTSVLSSLSPATVGLAGLGNIQY